MARFGVGLTRREFVRRGAAGLAFAGTALGAAGAPAALPSWRIHPGAPFSPYGQPAAEQVGVTRAPAANPDAPGNGVSWTPLHELEGTLTPSGLHFERHHNGVPSIPAEAHRLRLIGRVRRPLVFDLAALLRYPRVTRQCFIECGGNSNALWRRRPLQAPVGHLHGLLSGSEWTGVPLAMLLEEAGVEDDAQWVIAGGTDAFGLTTSLPLAKARDDCLLALFQNGERLRPEQGYPLRLLVPGWEGVLHVKWLTSLELSTSPAMARNETARYTELQQDGRARAFTFVMGPKSVITAPSPGFGPDGPGLYELSGLAWSGHGAVARVEVSLDGGRSWRDARLDAPRLPASLTRFRYPWAWDGSPCMLWSRATDESGRVQPARGELLVRSSRAAYFHYNGILGWAVSGDGDVRHVYPGEDDAPPPDDLDGLLPERAWD